MITNQKHLQAAQAVLGATVVCATATHDLLGDIKEIYASTDPIEPYGAQGDPARVILNLAKIASAFFSPTDNTNRSQPS